MKSWVVYGPQGCGKTRNAKAIAAHLGLSRIQDDWTPGERGQKEGVLYLTNDDMSHVPDLENLRRVISYSAVMAQIRGVTHEQAH